MGRRKIEIRPIKDDRNRSVTFLKRKGGLFKKAYELGVLCQVDVAVIIFGHNKKLYEFSSGNIQDTIGRFQYYNGAHEHKGPADFAGKGGDDDDDEDIDTGSPPPDLQSPPEQDQMAHNLHHQPNLQHVRGETPSGSPPIPNGVLPAHHRSSPQPGNMSRPASRTSMPRRPSNLAPPQYTPPAAQMAQGNYGFAPANHFYPQQANMPRGPQHTPPFPSPGHPQMQQVFIQESRRQSLPPAFQHQGQQPPPPQPSPQLHLQPPNSHHPLSRKNSPQPPESYISPPIPQSKPLSSQSNSHSIFTPIEDSRSLLAQHWGAPPPSETSANEFLGADNIRSQSIDVGSISYQNMLNGTSPHPTPPSARSLGHYPVPAAPPPPQRTSSSSSLTAVAPPSRSNTMQSTSGNRPRLKVQIPSEASDAGSTAGDSAAARDTSTSAHPLPAKGVVLPPPSPSAANPLLSAGATGPPNPFARPPPPSGGQSGMKDLETPLSALPSRVMEGNMLPSPSDIWGNMFSSRGAGDMMPSPLNFQTPVVERGRGWEGAGGVKDEGVGKRGADGELAGEGKRIRT